MLKVGITGQSGFMGTHLYNFLGMGSDIKEFLLKMLFLKTKRLCGNLSGNVT